MKKTLHLFLPLICLLFSIDLSAKEISISEAEKLVVTVIKRNARPTLKNARNIRVVERYTKKNEGKANFHIFNLSPTGFVIISADDRYNAVLAFSDESNINLNEEENYIGLWGTLSQHEARIQYIRQNNQQPFLAIQNEWKTLRSGNTTVSRDQGVIVAPLTTTKWNQGTYYNAECPANEDTAESGPDGRTYCGCGPIAMAQLIKFHNSPVVGNGSNSYVDPIYGEQTADFCATEYNWDNMPDELTAPNADVAKLIYHMGVSTFTYYSTDYTETYLSYMRDAFVNNFGFDQSANWFYDANGDFNWVARNDLDRGRPLLLSGVSVFGGAHTWVADGYGNFDASGGEGDTEYFHFNWGWGGDNNGWFLDTDESWFPRGDEPNNVEITYYFDRYVVQNLFPAKEGCQSPESIYTTGLENNSIYLNVYYTSGEQDISFRYRKLGTADWTETPATTNFFQLATDLESASEYEFQARRKCCPSDWSPYSESQTFATSGFVPCTPLPASAMSADATSDNTTYVYTLQPFGAVTNQFRYRPVGATEWSFTDNADTHFRYLTGLDAGTEYELQVTQQCSNGDFAEFSGSFNFTTTGQKEDGSGTDDGNTDDGGNDSGETSAGNCSPADGTSMTTSSITDTYAYIYTPQPYGTVNNQFRYRKVGSSNWLETDVSTSYYRFLADLAPGTTYEFQNRQTCTDGTWSNYSSSVKFTTTGEAIDGMENNENTGNTDDGGMSDEDGMSNGGEDPDNDNSSNGDCDPVGTDGLFTSSIGNNNAYIYTPQPLGAIQNQFRYKPVGFSEWAYTNIDNLYYRYLSNLSAGTQYEYQTRHECSTDNWSNYSESEYFMTTGSNLNNKVNATIPQPLSLDALHQANPTIQWTNAEAVLTIHLFPNPANNLVNLDLNKTLQAGDQILLIDKVGRTLKQIPFAMEQDRLQVNVHDLVAGIYMIQIRTADTIQVKKFIKQ